jgi:hypothetical protein
MGSSTAHHLFALKKRKATNENRNGGGRLSCDRARDGKRRDARKLLNALFLGQSAEAEINVFLCPTFLG